MPPFVMRGEYRAGVTGFTQRPLLFLDVDGPLIPFGAAPDRYLAYPAVSSANPLLARLNPEHGIRLMALPCELVWATSWLDDANECISRPPAREEPGHGDRRRG
jgi:hypothetical protein